MKSIYYCSALILLLIAPIETFASSCRKYPKKRGIDVIEVTNGVKIMSTAMANVPINDAEIYLDALEEAETEAKLQISRFISENLAESCTKDTKVINNVRVTSESKSVDFEKVKNELCSVTKQTQVLLRGSNIIGDCYTQGKFVLVTVGIKPETISNARKLSNNLNDSSASIDSSSSNSMGYSEIKSYSNTERLNNF